MMGKHLLILISLLTFFPVAGAGIVEGIAAVVNGEIITLSELESELERFLGSGRARMEGMDVGKGSREARRRALERLIEKKILLKEAKDKDIKIREEKIDHRIEDIKGKFASEEEFRQALRKDNFTEAKLRKRIEEDLMVSVLVDREVESKIRVGREEIRLFFEENRERFQEPEEVELSHILIKVQEGEGWGESERKGQDLLKQLREGANFSLLAKEYSHGPNAERGGKLGFLALGELSPEFEEAISGLGVGEISSLIRTEDGFHIIKLEGRKAPRQMELSEVRDRIKTFIFAEKWERRYREWIGELKKKAYIKIK